MDFNLKKGNVAISWSGIQLDNISILLPVFYSLCPYSPLSCRPLNTKCWFPSCFCADFSHPHWPDFWMQLICRPGQRLAAAALGVQLVSKQMGLSCTNSQSHFRALGGFFSRTITILLDYWFTPLVQFTVRSQEIEWIHIHLLVMWRFSS